MTNTAKHTPAIRAALAIINSTVNPALRHDAINVNARNLAEIIERETAVSELLEALITCANLLGDYEGKMDIEEGQAHDAAIKAITKATGCQS